MKDRILTEKEILDLSTRNEGHFYDRKAKEIGGKKIQKVSVAFANSDGGDFVVGIKDDSEENDPIRRWNGAPNREFFNSVLQNLHEITPSIPFSAEFLIDERNNSIGLRVTIEKSNRTHQTSDGTVYQRVGAQSLPLKDSEKIQALSFAKGESSYEDMVFKDAKAEDIFESKEITRFLLDYSPNSDPIDFTINQNLVDRDSYDPRMAGLLLFNDNPVALVPRKCGIKITRYETEESIPEREHLKKQISIEGCLYEQIHRASETIVELMSNIKIWTPDGLNNVDYPPETIWEILVNAVIHRDYSISDDIHILVFNNRIEVISPGKLPGYVTPKNILDARYSRNSKIVRTLNRYRNPPNKDMGEGLNTAFQKMEEWRLKPPIIEEVRNTVKVTIRHVPLATPEEQVLKFLENNSKIKNKDARAITGIRSENKMKRVFYKMRDNGILAPVFSKTGKSVVAWKKPD
jgi:ATP-dependent DNA helicase RecG